MTHYTTNQPVRGQDNRLAVLFDLLDDVPELSPAGRVHSGGGLIHEQDRGVPDQGHGDVQLPLVAAGVGAALSVGILHDV